MVDGKEELTLRRCYIESDYIKRKKGGRPGAGGGGRERDT